MVRLRRYILSLILLVSCLDLLNGQVRFGVRGGISTYDLGVTEAIQVRQGGSEFLLNVQDAKYGYHAGLVLQIKLASFVIQPELLFNSNSVDYRFGETTNPGSGNIFTERYQNLDIPLLLGLKAGPMRLMAGPVGHYFLKSTSELFEFESYDQKFSNLTYGWQGGIGVDLLNVMVDIRYEGNFYTFGDHIIFSGQRYNLASSPARLLASLAVTIK
jgi:hypothetical protein